MRILPSLAASLLALTLTGCFDDDSIRTLTITTNAGLGGELSPTLTEAEVGEVVSFYIEPDENYRLDEISGCDGTLNGDSYATAPMTQDCEITATFLGAVVDLPDREQFPEIDATISVDPDANYAFIPGSVRFTPSTGPDANLPAPLPEGLTPSSSLLEYQVKVENPGDTATITITYDEPIGLGHRPLKFGPETPSAEPTWFELPVEMFTYGLDGRSIDVTITDGGIGDRDGEANGVIDDPILITGSVNVNIIHTSKLGEALYSSPASNWFTDNPETTFAIVLKYKVTEFIIDGQLIPQTTFSASGSCKVTRVSFENFNTPFSISPKNSAIVTFERTQETGDCILIANHPRQHRVRTRSLAGVQFEPELRDIHQNLFATFNITTSNNTVLEGILGCEGATLNNAKTLVTVPDVTEACTLTPVLQTYTVTATTDGNGSVVGESSREVSPGSNTTFEFLPNPNYTVGTITGCGEGTRNGNSYTTAAITASCTVSASFQPVTYTITTAPGTGGSISPDSRTGMSGSQFNFTVASETGYEISSASVAAPGCAVSQKSGSSSTRADYGVTLGNENCTLSASFSRVSIAVTASAGANGDISPKSRSVPYGDDQLFSVSAKPGYEILSVKGCGINFDKSPDSRVTAQSFTSSPITEACSVSATFQAIQYTVKGVSSGGGEGTVTPRQELAAFGDVVIFDITPADSSEIGEIGHGQCGGQLEGQTYTTAPLAADCRLSVDFDIKTYTVTVNQTGEGAIRDIYNKDIGSSIEVQHAETAQLLVTPADGYTLGTLEGCGGFTEEAPFPGVTVIESEPVVADCEATIVFEPNKYQITTSVDNGGSWDPASVEFSHGQEAVTFVLDIPSGYEVNSVTGCEYTQENNRYTVADITADCELNATLKLQLDAPVITRIEPGDTMMTVIWEQVANATSYNVYSAKVSIDDVENYASLDGGTVTTFGATSIGTVMGLENGTEYFFRITTVQAGFESAASNQVSATPQGAGATAVGLNDTGALQCASEVSATGMCPEIMVPGQDAEYGRDKEWVDGVLSKTGGGTGSLDLTKLNENGVALAIQDEPWDVGGNEIIGSQWSCVQDNVTGRVWDSRVNNAASYRHNENFYTWYNTNGSENGGDAGLAEDISATPPFACVDGICNTEAYVAELNANAHCGFTDWRLPSMPEMFDLFGSEYRIDTDYFPHILPATPYWSGTTSSQDVSDALCVIPGMLPSVTSCPKIQPNLVMPVRAD